MKAAVYGSIVGYKHVGVYYDEVKLLDEGDRLFLHIVGDNAGLMIELPKDVLKEALREES